MTIITNSATVKWNQQHKIERNGVITDRACQLRQRIKEVIAIVFSQFSTSSSVVIIFLVILQTITTAQTMSTGKETALTRTINNTYKYLSSIYGRNRLTTGSKQALSSLHNYRSVIFNTTKRTKQWYLDDRNDFFGHVPRFNCFHYLWKQCAETQHTECKLRGLRGSSIPNILAPPPPLHNNVTQINK